MITQRITNLVVTTHDPIGFFEAIKLEGLEDKWLRIDYAVQRAFFDRVPFGKKAVKVTSTGEIWTNVSSGFGQDFEEQRYRFDHLANRFAYASGHGFAEI